MTEHVARSESVPIRTDSLCHYIRSWCMMGMLQALESWVINPIVLISSRLSSSSPCMCKAVKLLSRSQRGLKEPPHGACSAHLQQLQPRKILQVRSPRPQTKLVNLKCRAPMSPRTSESDAKRREKSWWPQADPTDWNRHQKQTPLNTVNEYVYMFKHCPDPITPTCCI